MSHYPKSPLMGQMMSQPLLISSIIKHADRYFGKNEIVSRRVEGDIHRYTYRDCHTARAASWPMRWPASGVKMGDRVATLAWNGYRHLEAYYAVSGSGAVLHTHQSAPVPGADRLHRQSCRRPVPVLRPDLPAAGRGDRRRTARPSRASC